MKSLREIRKDLSISQEALAHKSGCSVKTIRRYEKGAKVSLKGMLAISNAHDDIDPAEVLEFQERLAQYIAKESPLPEDDLEVHEIYIDDSRVTERVAPTPQPTEETPSNPGTEPSPIVDPPEITLAPVAKPSSVGVIKQGGKEEKTVPTNVPPISPIPFFLGLGKWGAIAILGFTAITVLILLWRNKKNNVSSSTSKEPVKPPEDDMLASFRGYL